MYKRQTLCRFFNKTVEITVDASDEGVSGIDKIEYRFGDENGQPTGSDWSVYDSENKPAKDPDFNGFVEARACLLYTSYIHHAALRFRRGR